MLFRELTRSRTIAAHRAADFGADRPYYNSGDHWTGEQCDAMRESLLARGFRGDIQINVQPLARSIPALARDAEYLMTDFASWWSRRNPVPIIEQHGPESELCWLPEPGWIEYFVVAAPCEANHANHAHIVVTVELTLRDECQLQYLARKRGLKVKISRNSDEWLAEKKGVSEHKSKVEYTVDHLRRRGSDFRTNRSQTPDWVRRAKRARFSVSVAATAGALASAPEVTLRPEATSHQAPQTGGRCASEIGAYRIDENIADVAAIPTGSPDSCTQFDAAEPGSEPIATERHTLVELHLERQEAVECRSWLYRTIKFVHIFRDDQGRRYCWYASNSKLVNLRGYKYPGRYPVLRGVPLTFDANVREVWPDGTVSLSRPYIRLDRQPGATRRAYAQRFGIPLGELVLESEAVGDAVDEHAQGESGGESTLGTPLEDQETRRD